MSRNNKYTGSFFLIFLGLVICFSQSANAQQWLIFTQSNSGLPSNSIKDITVDEFNNKWIATDNGLALFDGNNWTIYNTSNSGLPVNNIRCISIDGQGNKWIGTAGGLVKFDGSNWTVFKPDNSGIPDDLVRTIDFDSQGDVWVGTTTGIGRYDGVNWYVYSSNDSSYNSQILTSENIPAIDIGDDDVVAVGTINGGLMYLTDTSFVLYDGWTTGLPDNTILSMARDSYGNRWMGTPGAGLLVHYGDHEENVWSWYNTWNSPAFSNSITSVIVDNENRVITGSQDSGVAVFSGGLNWVNCSTGNSDLPSDFINAIALDNEGYLWIGTYNDGLARFDYGNWVGVVEAKEELKLKLYPNPSRGSFAIQTPVSGVLSITDIYGRQVYLENINAGTNTIELDQLSDAVYILTLQAENYSLTSRLVIAK